MCFLILTLIFLLAFSPGHGKVNQNLNHYELLHKSQISQNIVKRGADESDHPFNHIRELEFTALGEKFRLILSVKKQLLSSHFRVVEVDEDDEESVHHVDRDAWFEGRVFGEAGSDVSIHVEDGGLEKNSNVA